MPIAAMIIGAVMIDLAFRGTEHEFGKLAVTDFGGGSQFYAWAAAIIILAALGYVPGLRRVSSGLLALVVVVLVLVHGGAFTVLSNVIQHPPTPVPAITLASYKDPTPAAAPAGSKKSDSGAGTAMAVIGDVISIAAML